MKFYGYKKCDTCRKAMKWLDAQGVAYTFIDITEHPPSAAALKQALQSGYSIKQLFNTAGGQYRELGMKDKVAVLSEKEAIAMLSTNGYLCKRPLAIDGGKVSVGFKEAVYAETWGG